MTIEEKRQKYIELAHAMQTGVALDQAKGSNDGTPKHLRVGINCALSDHGALVKLLIAKGLFTEDEYYDHLIEFMQREVDRYEQLHGVRLG